MYKRETKGHKGSRGWTPLYVSSNSFGNIGYVLEWEVQSNIAEKEVSEKGN